VVAEALGDRNGPLRRQADVPCEPVRAPRSSRVVFGSRRSAACALFRPRSCVAAGRGPRRGTRPRGSRYRALRGRPRLRCRRRHRRNHREEAIIESSKTAVECSGGKVKSGTTLFWIDVAFLAALGMTSILTGLYLDPTDHLIEVSVSISDASTLCQRDLSEDMLPLFDCLRDAEIQMKSGIVRCSLLRSVLVVVGISCIVALTVKLLVCFAKTREASAATRARSS
jgi:hypothetical protein